MAFSLNELATFGASIGKTVVSTYQGVSQSRVPASTIPTSYQTLPPGARPGIQTSDIILYVLIGIAVIFGIKMLRK
jgi:uncharacterized RmlC-like cupin family protein